MRCVIFDTETTGLLMPMYTPLDKQPKIIELGSLVVEDGKIIREYSQLVNPGEPLDSKITKITGLTDEDLVRAPEFRKILDEVESVFANCDFLIAHNAPFDVGMLSNELLRCARTGFPWPANTMCTVQEYSHLFGKRGTLQVLYYHIMGYDLHQTHRALDDARAVYEILVKDGFFDRPYGTFFIS